MLLLNKLPDPRSRIFYYEIKALVLPETSLETIDYAVLTLFKCLRFVMFTKRDFAKDKVRYIEDDKDFYKILDR